MAFLPCGVYDVDLYVNAHIHLLTLVQRPIENVQNIPVYTDRVVRGGDLQILQVFILIMSRCLLAVLK